MDLSNKFNNLDPRRADPKFANLLKGKFDLNAQPKKTSLSKQLNEMKATALGAIGDTNWMFRGATPPAGNFAHQTSIEKGGVRFL